MDACDLISVELRLDRIEAELANELPPHMRSFARAYARGAALPPAPDVVQRATTLATARAALVHPLLADRGAALLRLVAPHAIESDPAVRAARAVPASWDALAALARARDAAAQARFGRTAIAVTHVLHGIAVSATAPGEPRALHDVVLEPGIPGALPALPPRIAAWTEPDGVALDVAAISHAWDAIRARHGVDGAVRFEPGDAPVARAARTFVVQPRGEVIVVLPPVVATPAARFTVLHELGHVLAALALPAGIPRVVDEAAAAYLARAIEREGELWYSPHASAARERRRALARRLDHVERMLPAVADPPAERPPWALWHDPGAQAAYAAAEAMADRIALQIGAAPAPGALAAALANHHEQIDRLTML